MGSSDEHIVMLPMMAHGHLIPFLNLAKQMQQRTGFTITIANTPLNINYLKSTTTSSNLNPKIHLTELEFSSSDHNLPPDTENTENLPLDKIIELFHSSQSLKTPLHNLLQDITQKEGKRPLCLISDALCGWAIDVARSVGVVHVTFNTAGAYGTLGYMSLWLNLPHRKTDSQEFTLPGFPNRCVFHVTHLHKFLRMADGSDPWSKYLQFVTSKALESYAMLSNTAEQLEPEPLEWLAKFAKIPIYSVGPLLHPDFLNKSKSSSSSSKQQHAGKTPGISAEKCLNWLDQQPPESVLYISFGSQNTISETQMMALAKGLEQSQVKFIWVIRPPIGYDLKGEFKAEWLPEGYEERLLTTNQGLLVKNWAPQLDILSHKSTGGFVSHCGWNSIMESLSQGVPIIGWPMAAEQGYNSKMAVEEMKVAVELTRGLQSCVEGEDVKRVIELVMEKSGKGKEMKENAMKISGLIREALIEDGEKCGSSLKQMDDFIQDLINRRAELSLKVN